jgi:CheY-like chemotaxis protein
MLNGEGRFAKVTLFPMAPVPGLRTVRKMKAKSVHLLIAEDDENDRLFLERAFRQAGAPGRIQFVNSGQEAIDYFKGEGPYADRDKFPYPTMVITDLKMPNGDGFDVLRFLKGNPISRIIPVAVLSASTDEDDINRAYSYAANCYLEKPGDVLQLTALMKLLLGFWDTCEVPQMELDGKQPWTGPNQE